MTTSARPRWRATGGGPGLRAGVLFMLPAAALFAVLILVPLLQAIGYSFFTWQGAHRTGFAALDNYTALFTQRPYKDEVLPALGHNLLLFAGAMVFQNSVGLLVAAFLHRFDRLRRLFQTIYTLPYLVSPIVIGYLWSLLLSPSFGPVNAVLKAVGLGSFAKPWLGDPSTALPVVILVNAWQYVGFPILLFGAALAGLPGEYAEAGRVDGANAWQRFFRITLPLLLPSIGVVSILTFIGCFNTFELVYSLEGAQGNQPTGPGGATDVLGLIFYRVAFQEGGADAIGQSSALAVLLFLFIFGVAVLANRIVRRREAELT